MMLTLYIASALGALGLLMILPRRGLRLAPVGGVVCAASLGGVWLYLAPMLPADKGLADAAMPYYYAFSGIALFAAVRVITHTKPVYAALWFVMVVLASTGLMVVLGAEFIAAATAVIYGGAILVTYVFVIMLAASAGDPEKDEAVPEYERVSWEPFSAVFTGFLLLAVLLTVFFQPHTPNRVMAADDDQTVIRDVLVDRPAAKLVRRFEAKDEQAPAQLHDAASRVENVERVGVDLFREHPLGLELAGVILLVSLVGAVVIARKRTDPAESKLHGGP